MHHTHGPPLDSRTAEPPTLCATPRFLGIFAGLPAIRDGRERLARALHEQKVNIENNGDEL